MSQSKIAALLWQQEEEMGWGRGEREREAAKYRHTSKQSAKWPAPSSPSEVITMLERTESPHYKTNKMTVRPANILISLGILPAWSESSLSAWRNLWSWSTHWVHREDSSQTGWIPRLIWVFTGRTFILLVLSCRGSFSHQTIRYEKRLHHVNKPVSLRSNRSPVLYSLPLSQWIIAENK